MVHHGGGALQDEVGEDSAGGGRVHDAVSAEAVGEEEARYIGNRAEYGVMVRGHLIESGPGAFGIDRQMLESRDTVSSVHQNFLDEGAFKVGPEARCFFGIVPGEEKAAAFRAEVKAGGHIDDHGRGVREVAEW